MPDHSSPVPITIRAEPADSGQRLDIFLGHSIGTISRSRVKGLILEGAVTRNGVITIDVSESVQAGATYTLNIPAATPAIPIGESIAFPILYEDKYLLVLDKPAGLVVHPAPGNPDGTLVNALIAHCGDSLTGIGGERRPGIVHRLDKDTSGVMVVAKTEPVHTALSAAFAARDIERLYKAVCWGLPNPASGAIEGDIGRDPRERKRMAVVTRNGKPALTNYALIRAFGAAAALISCQLATGRTHQIRVHLAHIGHPLVGDPVYLKRRPAAAKGLNEPARSFALDFPRQALHAEILGFLHPITRQTLRFEAPPPTDFRHLVEVIETGL
ncbi:MAG TPA: RluA family pseudouridine synthase [Acidocella sp.]|nr:MAG: RNA pseudouridine synthase [Acidocella sp. 20-58-15]HQT39761.1 RluA family pseudouridine synthase [Acidocella sp.]